MNTNVFKNADLYKNLPFISDRSCTKAKQCVLLITLINAKRFDFVEGNEESFVRNNYSLRIMY